MKTLLIKSEENGLTCLEILKRRIPAAPQSYLAQLLRREKILREQKPVNAATVLRNGDILLLPDSDRLKELLLASAAATVDILLENPLWLVAFKPAGMAMHRGVGHERDNLTDRVQAWLKQQGEAFRASPVHRLDVGTSGPVLFAKGRRAAGLLGKALMDGKMEKIYLALAKSRLREDRTDEIPPGGTVPGTLASREGLLISSVPSKGKMKEATTRYQILSENDSVMLLRLELVSGRNHQIRRQMAEAGHPLVGDRRYGGPGIKDLVRPFLHCYRLAWPDPLSHTRQQVTCPLPDDLSNILAATGLSLPD